MNKEEIDDLLLRIYSLLNDETQFANHLEGDSYCYFCGNNRYGDGGHTEYCRMGNVVKDLAKYSKEKEA